MWAVLGSDVMTLQELLTETVKIPSIECWNNESTASALRARDVAPFDGSFAPGDSCRPRKHRHLSVTSGGVSVGSSRWRGGTRPADGGTVVGRDRRDRDPDRPRVVLAIRRD